MKILLPYALFVLASTGTAGSATQTDWSGGGGVPGPVDEWGDTFDSVTGIGWLDAPGDLLLGGTLVTPVVHLLDGSYVSSCIRVHDIDGEGDNDVLSTGAQYATWWRNEGGGTAWTRINLTTSRPGSQSVDAGDVDGNGTCDVVLGVGYIPPQEGLYWFENTDGSGTVWAEHHITSGFGVKKVCASDINGDGKLDIAFLSTGSPSVYWYENVDGLGFNWMLHTCPGDSSFQRDLKPVDLDGDGDIDLLNVTDSGFYWFENTDGTGGTMLWHEIGASTYNRSVSSVDVDGDGDLDVLAGSLSATFWYENLDGSATDWVLHPISSIVSSHSRGLDLDADGDGDFLSAAGNFLLLVNDDGLGTSWTQVTLATSSYTSCCEAGDLDGDGFDEGLTCKFNDGDVIWVELVEPVPSGQLTSSILATGEYPLWGNLNWTESCPAGSDITLEFRVGYTPGTMGAWFSCSTPGTAIPSYMDNHPFCQYRVNLEKGSAPSSPVLYDMTVDWNTTGTEDGQGAIVPSWSFAPLQNPARGGVLGMSLGAAAAGPVAVRVFDLSGRVIAETEVQASAGLQTVSFTGLPAGVFLCTAEVPGYTCAVRVVVID